MVGGRAPIAFRITNQQFSGSESSLSIWFLSRRTSRLVSAAPQVNHDGDVVQHVALGGLGRYSTEIVTTAEAIEPSWLREIWICGIDPAPIVERCAERAFRRSCITA